MSAPPYQSLMVKSWNVFARLVPGSAMSPDLSSEALMKKAIKIAQCSDFGADDFQEGLAQLVSALDETGDLHPFGRFFAQQMLAELLANRLRLVDVWKRQPEILEERIESPLFILGLPRSGTSFLFNLLAQHPDHRVLANWETTVSQVPPPGNYAFEDDPRRKKGASRMALQRKLSPQMKEIHEFHLDGPEECTPLLMQSFATQALAVIFNVPSYSRWLDGASHRATYRHHKRIIQTLQWKYPATRWVFKSPDHLQALDSLLEVYPDARIVQMHRDPATCVPSWASLNHAFRSIHTRRIESAELGEQAMRRLAVDMERFQRARGQDAKSSIFDVSYADLVGDPRATVASIYRRFDIEHGSPSLDALEEFLGQDRAKKGAHDYSAERFGLAPESIREHFRGNADAAYEGRSAA